MRFVLYGLILLNFANCLSFTVEQTKEKAGLTWVVYSKNTFDDLISQKKNLFVLAFADWCPACERMETLMSIQKEDIYKVLQSKNITSILADRTKDDPEVLDFLRDFKAPGVPFVVIFPKGDLKNPIILPNRYTIDDLIKALSTIEK